MIIQDKKLKKRLITHNGSFHADDIFACATLILTLEKDGIDFEIIRTRDEELIKGGDYVFDIGGIYDESNNRFDHHQVGGAGCHDNGIEYASIGLVWKKFGIELCKDQKVVDLIDKKLITPIDAGDNGIELVEKKYDTSPYFLQNIFNAMRPTWREEDINEDEIFLKCVEFAKIILSREIIQATDAVLAEESIVEIYNKTEDKRIVVLDKENYPFNNTLSKFREPLFVIYFKKINNTWNLRAIREDEKTFKNRKNLPIAWSGLRDEELQKVTGVPDARFCHRGLFLAVAGSYDGAIKLAQNALES